MVEHCEKKGAGTMTKTIHAADILSLFGKPLKSPEVESLLQDLETLNRPQPDYENEDYYDWVMVRRKGVELGFEEAAYHQGSDEALWEGTDLRLYQVYFYTAFDDIQTFAGALPFGLDFGDSRAVARKKMARYESSRHPFITDTWDTESSRLNIRYTEDKNAIERMACEVNSSPIPGKTAAEYPALADLIAALGAEIHAPVFTRLWDADTNAEIQTLILEEEMCSAFLNRSYGADLNFTGEDEKRLQSITLLGHRQMESVNWQGELPCGLSFEDSPETLFQKMQAHKPAPDESSTDMDDNTDYALWHFSDYSLHVLYSHLYNRILRIGLYEAGVW
jgi:hypothetical protein